MIIIVVGRVVRIGTRENWGTPDNSANRIQRGFIFWGGYLQTLVVIVGFSG